MYLTAAFPSNGWQGRCQPPRRRPILEYWYPEQTMDRNVSQVARIPGVDGQQVKAWRGPSRTISAVRRILVRADRVALRILMSWRSSSSGAALGRQSDLEAIRPGLNCRDQFDDHPNLEGDRHQSVPRRLRRHDASPGACPPPARPALTRSSAECAHAQCRSASAATIFDITTWQRPHPPRKHLNASGIHSTC